VSKQKSTDIRELVNLANNEVIVKYYEGFKTAFPRGYGGFLITNYRFIFLKKSEEWNNKTVTMTEIPLSHIGGIKSEYGRKAIKLQKVIATILFLLGATGLALGLAKVLGSYMNIIGGVFLAAAIIVFIFSRRRVFSLEILSKSATGSMLSVTNDFFKKKKDTKILVGKETSDLIRDLGKAFIEAQNYKTPYEQLKNEVPKTDLNVYDAFKTGAEFKDVPKSAGKRDKVLKAEVKEEKDSKADPTSNDL